MTMLSRGNGVTVFSIDCRSSADEPIVLIYLSLMARAAGNDKGDPQAQSANHRQSREHLPEVHSLVPHIKVVGRHVLSIPAEM